MHESAGVTRLDFSPDLRLTALTAAGALAAALVALFASDSAGRLLAATAAAVLAGYAFCDLSFRPRLRMDGAGLRVRAPLTQVELGWSQVERFETESRLRLGLRTVTLEIDAGSALVVLSRRALGADPDDVAELARALRPVVD